MSKTNSSRVVMGQKRNLNACLACRKSKRRCDSKDPCYLCTRRGVNCIYETTSKRKPATQDYTESLKRYITTLEEAVLHYKTTDDAGLSSNESGYEFYPNLSRLNFPHTHDTAASEKQSGTQLKDEGHFIRNYWKLNIKNDGRILFEGPTSSRYISTSGSAYSDCMKSKFSLAQLDTFHKQIFEWYFKNMNNSLPLINEDLFFFSLQNSLEDDRMGKFASNSLVNCMMAIFYMKNEEDYQEFETIAIQQVNEEIRSFPRVTTIQSLILLFTIKMTNGEEFMASDFMARAVSLCYHLGLHIRNSMLVSENKLNVEEAKLRDMVFWCCFLVDRLKITIFGMHPLLNCTDISIKLPELPRLDPKAAITEVFKETICFSDLQLKLLETQYSANYYLVPSNSESASLGRKLVISKGLQKVSEWRKNLPSGARYVNDQSPSSTLLEISQQTLKILMNKSLLTIPMMADSTGEDASENSPIFVCTTAAVAIIKICEAYDLSQDLLSYQYLYSLYLSSIICLFNCTSSCDQVKKKNKKHLKTAFGLFEKYLPFAKVAELYHSNLRLFQRKWDFEFSSNQREEFEPIPASEISSETASVDEERNSLLDANMRYPSWADFSDYMDSHFTD